MTRESFPVETPAGRAEQVRIVFLETDVDMAFTFLRLAETESKIGNGSRAGGLLEKAILGYKEVIKCLGAVSIEDPAQITSLRQRSRDLFEAIVAVENRFRIL